MTDLARAIKIAKELEFRQRTNLMKLYKPYPYQLKFHNSHASQRLLMAGNRVGKSFCGAMEMAYHCTGLYPNWWKGKKFNRPVRCMSKRVMWTTRRSKRKRYGKHSFKINW